MRLCVRAHARACVREREKERERERERERHESNSAFLRVILGISLGFKGLEETSLGLEETS
jgi:hypothetical protein